ncbi:hypothetical protein ABZ930_26730 [Streptomyces sp. NPDC046716]
MSPDDPAPEDWGEPLDPDNRDAETLEAEWEEHKVPDGMILLTPQQQR